jgi:hypothetical protein
VLLHVLAGALLIASRPLWLDHEADFYAVARALATQGRIPAPEEFPPGTADAAQVTQPPLYYYLAAPIVALIDRAPVTPLVAAHPPAMCVGGEAFNSIQHGTVLTPDYGFPPSGAPLAATILRLFGLFTLTGAVIFTYAAGRLIAPTRPALAVIAAALLALEPTTLTMAVTISNDVLIVLLSAANFYALLKLFSTGQWRWAGVSLLIAALAMLARLPGWAVLAVTLIALALVIGRSLLHGVRSRRGLLLPGLAALGVAVVVGLVLLLNVSRSGTILGRYANFEAIFGEMTGRIALSGDVMGAVLRASAENYLGNLPLATRYASLQGPLVFAPLLLMLAGLAYALVVLLRRPREHSRLPASAGLLLASIVITTGLVLVRNAINVQASGGFSSFNGAAIFAPLRYYTPALPAAALLFGLGWLGLGALAGLVMRGERPRQLMRGLVLAGGLALAGFFAFNAISGAVTRIQTQPRTEVMTPETLAILSSASPADDRQAYADGLPRISSYRALPDPETGLIDLTLWLTVEAVPRTNAALVVRVADQTCTFAPARGYETPLAWRPGEVRVLHTRIPNCAASLPADAPISVGWSAAAPDGQVTYQTEPVSLGTTGGASLPIYRGCPATLGIFAGTFWLVKFNSPPEVARGENYQPSLNWIVQQASDSISGRVITFTHDATGTAYTCAQGDIAMSAWVTGEYRYFDRCVLVFPDDAPTGPYTASVTVLANDNTLVPVTDAAGVPQETGSVPVGTVTVR